MWLFQLYKGFLVSETFPNNLVAVFKVAGDPLSFPVSSDL